MTGKLIGIRTMCELFKVTPRSLRFYEEKELIFPIREGQKRLFTKQDRARLTLIQRGKRFGFSLEEIRRLLNLYHEENGRELQLEEAYKLAVQHLKDMKLHYDELDSSIQELRGHMEWATVHLKCA